MIHICFSFISTTNNQFKKNYQTYQAQGYLPLTYTCISTTYNIKRVRYIMIFCKGFIPNKRKLTYVQLFTSLIYLDLCLIDLNFLIYLTTFSIVSQHIYKYERTLWRQDWEEVEFYRHNINLCSISNNYYTTVVKGTVVDVRLNIEAPSANAAATKSNVRRNFYLTTLYVKTVSKRTRPPEDNTLPIQKRLIPDGPKCAHTS